MSPGKCAELKWKSGWSPVCPTSCVRALPCLWVDAVVAPFRCSAPFFRFWGFLCVQRRAPFAVRKTQKPVRKR